MNKRSKFKYTIGQKVQYDAGSTASSRWLGYNDNVEAEIISLELKNGEPYVTIKYSKDYDEDGKTKEYTKEIHQTKLQ